MNSSLMNWLSLQVKQGANKIINEMKKQTQWQTAANSPIKMSQENFLLQINSKRLPISNHLSSHFSSRQSETQRQIYSHPLVKEVMQQSRLRSVRHDINRIDQQTTLYSKPIATDHRQFNFDSIPSTNRMYASHCSAKVKQIQQGLDEVKAKAHNYYLESLRDKKQVVKKRPVSASSRIDTRNPKVSVSGLVSYNFNSVNARKSLGLSKVNHEQRLVDSTQASERRRGCSTQRGDRILAKTSGRRYLKHSKNQQAIMYDFVSDTDIYLRHLVQEEEQNTLIYNEGSKKLNYIKQYMEQQRVGYDDAAHIVNEIEGGHGKGKGVAKGQVKKIDVNDESLLRGRRMPVQRKPIMVRHFVFIE